MIFSTTWHDYDALAANCELFVLAPQAMAAWLLVRNFGRPTSKARDVLINLSVGLLVGIAALFAVGVVAVALFGDHQSWFVRAAQGNAARCLTASPCVRIDAHGAIVKNAPPPLPKDSRCAKPKAWAELKAVSNGQTKIVVLCVDGNQPYLYHMGRLSGGEAGAEQWLACRTAGCSAEIALLKERMN